MRFIFPLLANLGVLLCSVSCLNATVITSATVSGTWTTSGSPYIIQTNVSVPATQTLRIEAGVEVVFDSLYTFDVYGVLQVDGSQDNRVVFRASDTAGWANDSNPAGGWRLMWIHAAPPADSSFIRGCDMRDLKNGMPFTGPGIASGFWIQRGLELTDFRFYHNRSTEYSVRTLWVAPDGPAMVTFRDCEIFDNVSQRTTLHITQPVCSTSIIRTTIRNNIGGAAVWVQNGATLSMDSSNVRDNLCNIENFGAVMIHTAKGRLKGNRIHHNVSRNIAAINCLSSDVWIDNNFVCNNTLTDRGSCGPADGGGGIRINNYTTGAPFPTALVRNNVIANNHSSFIGGGVCINGGAVLFANNTVMNNTAAEGGPAIAGGADEPLTFKNNIFSGNASPGYGDRQVSILSLPAIRFENNWLNKPVYQTVRALGGFVGDTTTNIISTSAGLVAPTTSTGVSTDAMTANFRLQAASLCRNSGDTAAAKATAYDLANANRLIGTIDIGAYEFPSSTPSASISEVSGGPAIYVAPNPARQSLIVTTPEAAGVVQLISLTGTEVARQMVTRSTTSVEVAHLPTGLYIIEWRSGSHSLRTRVVVQH